MVLSVFISACTVTSDNPLSPPESTQVDPRLLGDWQNNEDHETYHFNLRHGAWMHVDIFTAILGDKTESYDFFPTVIGDNTFLNGVLTGKDDRGHPTKTYTFARYTFSNKNELSIWMISQDAAAAAVRAGKLEGTFHQDANPAMAGHPPHPDVDVYLSATSTDLANFVRDANLHTLFEDKPGIFQRIASKQFQAEA